MSEERGQRRGKREKVLATVELTWKDRSGGDRYASAETVDISELGIFARAEALGRRIGSFEG